MKWKGSNCLPHRVGVLLFNSYDTVSEMINECQLFLSTRKFQYIIHLPTAPLEWMEIDWTETLSTLVRKGGHVFWGANQDLIYFELCVCVTSTLICVSVTSNSKVPLCLSCVFLYTPVAFTLCPSQSGFNGVLFNPAISWYIPEWPYGSLVQF